MKFRTRLIITLIPLLIFVFVGTGLVLGQLFKNYYLNALDDRLSKESFLVATYTEDIGGIQYLNSERINDFSKKLKARISIIGMDGKIVFDSGEINQEVDDYADITKNIKELDKASIDELNRNNNNLKYYFEPIIIDGKKVGFVCVSAMVTELTEAYAHIWWLLTLSFGFAFIFILTLGMKIMKRYTNPIENATNVAFDLAKGNYYARANEAQPGEIGMLSSSLNILAQNLQEMKKTHEMQQDRLAALIENMGSGIILIDGHGFISLINRTYKELFDVQASDFLNKPYYEVIEHTEIHKIIDDIFMTEQKIKQQIVLPLKIERRHFEVYGVPIIGENDVWKGILLVFHDITEIKKLEQMRKDFVANVSHELKTPVTSIKGFSETLLDGAMKDRETLETFLNIILKESDRLQSLIYDLLELSKIENEGFRLSIVPFNIIEVLKESIRIMEVKAEEKEIDILFNPDKDTLWIDGDVDRIKQVFINIISNAVSYTPNNGEVIIVIEENDNKVIVHIKDTGLGINKEEIPRIFERFYRVNKARDRNTGGTGLGLAIVKHLIEALKGKVSVHSEFGKGTTFSIEFNKKFPSK